MAAKIEKRTWDELYQEAQAEYYAARKVVYRNSLLSAPATDQKHRMILAAVRVADLMIDDGEKNPEIKHDDE